MSALNDAMSRRSPSCCVFLLLIFAAAGRAAPTFDGFVSLRGGAIDAPRSWRDGGFGRFDWGEESGGGQQEAVGQADLTFAAGDRWSFFVHGVLRAEPGDLNGRAAGLIELYGEWNPAGGGDGLTVRAGHFLLPTSRENTEIGWSSPYTLTFSALNTWIGEEVRVNGVGLFYRLALGDLDELRLMSVAFVGNDTSGTLLAWRGFAMSSRLTAYDEVLPLPPLFTLAPYGLFSFQQDRGTQPFGPDLDGRVGYFAAARWRRPEKLVVQLSLYDNRGDRQFYRDSEYSWQTRYLQAGLEWQPDPRWTLLGEWLDGRTGMGRRRPDRQHVDVDFSAFYAMASFRHGSWRASLRYDDFTVSDYDGVAESGDDQGHAVTAALFYELSRRPLRFGLEYLELDSEHPAAAQSGFPSRTDGRSVSLELRYFFSP